MQGDRLSVRTKKDMEGVLLSPTTPGPEVFYYMLRGGKEMGNITILEPGRSGGEYIKTLGHYHPYDFSENYRVLEGEGLMLLQKRKFEVLMGKIGPRGNRFRLMTMKVQELTKVKS